MRNILLLFLVLICQKIYSKEKIYMLLNCVEKETKRKIELVNLKIYNNDKEVDYKLMEDGVLVLNCKKLKKLKIQFSDNIIDFGKLNKLNDKKFIEIDLMLNKNIVDNNLEIAYNSLGCVRYILKKCNSKENECNKIEIRTPSSFVWNEKKKILELYDGNPVFNKYIDLKNKKDLMKCNLC